MWNWIWPRVGSQPISQGTDSEMFDRTDYPYTETFVREAIQNTLDARLDQTKPAIISFRFHRASLTRPGAYLEGAIKLREEAGLHVPPGWRNGSIDWLTIEDFNTQGLDGDLNDRLDNFWGYWLNFGLSNKDGHGRGGRGIGRITFLITSQIQTVVGITRRFADGRVAASGMTLLRAMRANGRLRSTHAYLAASENDEESIFHLHDSAEFHDGFISAFGMSGYGSAPYESGLALAIPYPHEELKADGILASAIEHFAPAILNGSLTVRVDDRTLDSGTLDRIASDVADRIHTDWIRDDVDRYLTLVREGLSGDAETFEVDVRQGLVALRDSEQAERLRQKLNSGDTVVGSLRFDLTRASTTRKVSLTFVAAETPEGRRPADRLFREGMSLPDVKSRSPGELDLLLLVDDDELATYLNFCEGKAHLDLLESKEVRSKLEEKRYGSPPFRVKRFVKALPADIRDFLTPEITEPETDVFDAFFSVPDADPNRRQGPGGKPEKDPPPPPLPPPPRIPAMKVRTLDDGFRLEANPDYTDWPINVSVSMAYADGTRNPAWSVHDFRPEELDTVANNCELSFVKNKLTARSCGEACSIEVTGFDNRRELETRIKVWKHAQDN
jgi:hypothetical protein